MDSASINFSQCLYSHLIYKVREINTIMRAKHLDHLQPSFFKVALLLLLHYLDQAISQSFIRDCNHPTIVAHSGGDSYCEHACGFFFNPSQLGTPVCTASGMCICQCEVGVPQATLASYLCPKTSDPPDTDPNAVANCARDCTGVCIGGISQVCGEQAPTTNAKICVCSCPPNGCPRSLTVTPVNSTNTAVIPIILPQLLSLKISLWAYLGLVLSKFKLWSCLIWIYKLYLVITALFLYLAIDEADSVSSLPVFSSFS